MQTRLLVGVATLLLVSLSSACVNLKSYVDPSYRSARYEDVRARAKPVPVRLEVSFTRNGEPLPSGAEQLRDEAVRVLRESRVLLPSSATGAGVGVLRIAADNVYFSSESTAAGIAAGVSFGNSGGLVSDRYNFTLSYRGPDGSEKGGNYQHRLYTTPGEMKLPRGVALVSPDQGFGIIVEDVLLNFLRDMQLAEDGKAPLIFVPLQNEDGL